MRDAAVARHLVQDGWRCAFAVSTESYNHVAALLQDIGDVRALSDDLPATRALATQWPDGCDWLIVDCYSLDIAFERACRDWARGIAVFEDIHGRAHDCDLLVDPTLDRAPAAYDALIPSNATRLCGIAYAALADEFQQLRVAGAAARRNDRPAAERRLFVSFGGGDTTNILIEVLSALAMADFPWPIDVAAVGGAEVRSRLAAILSRLAAGSMLYLNRHDLAPLMADAWAAVGAAGTMAWQRACLGLPSVMIETAANQADVAAALARRGAAQSLGPQATVDSPAAAAAIRQLFDDPAAHRTMSEAALALTDGLGARRIAAALAPEMDRQGRAITLRPATAGDAELMLAWQSAPGIRTHARQPSVPTRSEHEAWLRRRLVDPLTILNIIEAGGRAAGVLRFDRVAGSDPSWEISILVAPEAQGGGVGAAALAAARGLLPEADLVAEVLPANQPSHRLFRAAGYEWRDGRYIRPAQTGANLGNGAERPERQPVRQN